MWDLIAAMVKLCNVKKKNNKEGSAVPVRCAEGFTSHQTEISESPHEKKNSMLNTIVRYGRTDGVLSYVTIPAV